MQDAMTLGLPVSVVPRLLLQPTRQDILTAQKRLAEIMQSFESAGL